MRPPFSYAGGKTKLAPVIAAMLPAHDHYVEPFYGGGAVLLAKPRARMETVNDIDGDLMTFWRVLRDQPEELTRVCALTPHSRAGLAEDRAGIDDAPTDVERARRVWSTLAQSRTGTLRTTGWRYYETPGGSNLGMPEYMAAYVERMLPVAERLAGVSLESRPALEIIARYGRHTGVLLYCDPPYLGSVRNSRGYRHEMAGDTEHSELLDALRQCAATVVLSGYASHLYDTVLADWDRHECDVWLGQGGVASTRTEVLWANRPLARGSQALLAI